MPGRTLTTTLRRLLAGTVAVGALAAAATPAAAAPAAERYAVGSAGMAAAQDIARSHWGADACGGQVDISWRTLDDAVNARSMWANPRSAYDDPELNFRCRMVFNRDLDLPWEKFCTVLVHEYGHLVGHDHAGDGVMAAIYQRPLGECARTADPFRAESRNLGRSHTGR